MGCTQFNGPAMLNNIALNSCILYMIFYVSTFVISIRACWKGVRYTTCYIKCAFLKSVLITRIHTMNAVYILHTFPRIYVLFTISKKQK
jgi:hypothetical protein